MNLYKDEEDEEDQENEIEEDQEPNDTFPTADEGQLSQTFYINAWFDFYLESKGGLISEGIFTLVPYLKSAKPGEPFYLT